MMAHRFVTLLLLAVFAGGCSKSDSDDDPAEIPEFSAFRDPSEAPEPIRKAARAVVRIQSAGSYATGSFISADGLMLTNNHVLGVDVCAKEGCYAKITRMHQRGEAVLETDTIFVQPVHVDVGLDAAILQAFTVEGNAKTANKLSTPDFITLEARDSASLLGSHVHVVGHPEGKLKKWTHGDVAQAAGSWFKSTAFILPGNSGSPLLDDQGRVVGLLHRGPTAQDLVTRRGINVYSIGTASAAIVAAMQAPLPPSIRAVNEPATAEDVVEHHSVYLNARVAWAKVKEVPPATPPAEPVSKSVLSLLGSACDKGLARNDYDSPEDLSSALQPCYEGLDWIDCSNEPASYRSCPGGEERTAWLARFQGAFDRYRALNGQLDFEMAAFGPAALEPGNAGESVGRANVERVIAEAQPPLDFSLSIYLSYFGITDYAGTSLAQYVRDYTKAPHYELSIPGIASTAYYLNRHGQLSLPDAKKILADLANDDKASLGSKLYIEEIRYNSGFL